MVCISGSCLNNYLFNGYIEYYILRVEYFHGKFCTQWCRSKLIIKGPVSPIRLCGHLFLFSNDEPVRDWLFREFATALNSIVEVLDAQCSLGDTGPLTWCPKEFQRFNLFPKECIKTYLLNILFSHMINL